MAIGPGGAKEDELRAALSRQVAERWGEDRVQPLKAQIDRFARAMWLIGLETLDPMVDQPDSGGEGGAGVVDPARERS